MGLLHQDAHVKSTLYTPLVSFHSTPPLLAFLAPNTPLAPAKAKQGNT